MKKGIHPQYHQVTFKCACGATFIAGSTITADEFNTEICSNCHPLYTGKQKLVDSSGRVEKFMAKMKKAQEKKEKDVKKTGKKHTTKAAKESTEEAEEETEVETEAETEEKTEETAEKTV